MLKVLTTNIPNDIGLPEQDITEYVITVNGAYPTYDKKACGACMHRCEHPEVFNFNAEGPTYIYELENYIYSLYNGCRRKEIPSICDILIVNSKSFILSELTCSQVKYIADSSNKIGKRQKAISQINSSINLLYSCGIEKAIDRLEHIGVFAFRIPEVAINDKATQSMNVFSKPLQVLSSIQTEGLLSHDFIYKQVQYPNSLSI